MLIVHIPIQEGFDESTERFVVTKTYPVAFEHSLLSLFEWEGKYEKPFLSNTETHTEDEILDYLKMMVVNPAVDLSILNKMSPENSQMIQEYINAKATATRVNEIPGARGNGSYMSAELIYYWMFSLGIPKECETWHLNRLLTLIKVFDAKNKEQDPKYKNKIRMPQSEAIARDADLNAKRKAQLGTTG